MYRGHGWSFLTSYLVFDEYVPCEDVGLWVLVVGTELGNPVVHGIEGRFFKE